MKITSDHTQEVWESGDFAGDDRRPAARVTIQRMVAAHPQYRLDESQSADWAHNGYFLSMLFGYKQTKPRELRNVRSVKWERGTDTDVGSCTIVLANVEARTAQDPASDTEMDLPGYYTPNRGVGEYFDEWGYLQNTWKNWLLPDRLIRTYEGYGSDTSLPPEKDPFLYPSGTWLIDDVTISTDGTITIACRDLGKVLLDQIIFYGLVPAEIYPLWFDTATQSDRKRKVVAPVGGWKTPAYDTDSNRYYADRLDLVDNGRTLVAADNTVYGHHPRDAFDGPTYTYWVSTGFKDKHRPNGYVYIQGKMASPTTVGGVQIDAQHGPYHVYVSLQDSTGKWLGNKKVPYKQVAGQPYVPAAIPYVKDFVIAKGETLAVDLPKKYPNIKKIRYTFGELPWEGFGLDYCNHAAINKVYYATDTTFAYTTAQVKNGNYVDYVDIVKWLLAWSGWYWPVAESGENAQTYSDGSTYDLSPQSGDPVLVNGRVWGDMESTGTNGLVKFDVDTWDKKPIMDGIGVVRDIVGFDFWIDETGGAIFRLPNIWTKGSYIMPTKGGVRQTRTTELITVDERKHLLNLEVKLSGRNSRERIFVANHAEHIGAVVQGYVPAGAGLKRYAGWTDQHFKTNDECERMADLIALKQSFTYRQNNLTISANPAMQPDDQIIIKERMTGEGYIHRITNISSDFDNDTGQWTYTLTTNWLGNEAFTDLAWDPKKLTNPTRVYLAYMGKLPA